MINVGTLLAILRLQDEMSPALQQATARLNTVGASARQTGAALTAGLTVPIAAVGTGALTAAIQYESAFTGVIKTTDGVVDAFGALTPLGQELRQGFLDMSTEIPIAATELAAVGEAAGQLGIEGANILGFTRVMADLGVTTNLSADEAATSLARLANITQMPQTEFQNLGSSVVALGNSLATTEAEIVTMGLRLAGAGNQIGLSEAQIVSFAGAMSSVGIQAEAGGTAFSKVMLEIGAAVDMGGQSLDLFAQTAGLATADFVQLFEQDASAALVAFIQGLENTRQSGGNLTAALDEMGFGSIRVRDTLLRLSGAGDLVTSALDTGARAWEENTALAREAELRYATTESQIALLKNGFTRLATELGLALLPLMHELVQVASDVIPHIQSAVTWFTSLESEHQKQIVAVAGVVAAIGPFVIILGTVVSAVSGLVTLVGTLSPMVAGLGTVFGAATAVLVAGVATWQLFAPIFDAAEQAGARLRVGLIALKDNGLAALQALFTGARDWLVDRWQVIVDGVQGHIDRVIGLFDRMKDVLVGNSTIPEMIDAFAQEFGRLDTVMVGQSQAAASATEQVFADLRANVSGIIGQLVQGDIAGVMDTGLRIAEGHVRTFATNALSAVASLVPGVGPLISQFSGVIIDGLTALGGGVVNIFKGLGSAIAGLFGRSTADDIRLTFERLWGQELPQQTADYIAGFTDDMDDIAAILVNLEVAWKSMGGVSALSLQTTSRQARDLFSMIQTGQLTSDQAFNALIAVVDDLAAEFDNSSAAGQAQFFELIQLAQQFGFDVQAIADIIGQDLVDRALNADLSTAVRDAEDNIISWSDTTQRELQDAGAAVDAVKQQVQAGDTAIVAWGQAGSKAAQDIEAALGGVSSSAVDVDSRLHAVDWDGWKKRAVDAADAAKKAIDKVSLGSSPGGIKEIPIQLERATSAMREWSREAVETMDRTKEATDRASESVDRLWQGHLRGESINDFARRLEERRAGIISDGFTGDELARRLAAAEASLRREFRERGVPGFQRGTGGRFVDFGRGTPVLLHGRERIVTEREGRAEADGSANVTRRLERLMADLPRRIGLAIEEAMLAAPAR